MKRIVTNKAISEARSARLMQARRSSGFETRKEAAERLGVSVSTYTGHENGGRAFDEEQAQFYARAFKVPPQWLLAHDLLDDVGETLPSNDRPDDESVEVASVRVHGRAAGGLWMEGDVDEPFGEDNILVPAIPGYPVAAQYARRVVGNSVSNRIRDGEYAVLVRLDAYKRPLKEGMLVDVCRLRSGLREHTIKAFYGDKLMTDSAEMPTQQVLKMDHNDQDTTVMIIGVAVGVHRPLVY